MNENKKGERRMEYKKVEELLKKIDTTIVEVAKEVIRESKKESETFGDVEEKINQIKKSVYWENALQYNLLFVVIEKLLEKEKNDLPLTNRSNS